MANFNETVGPTQVPDETRASRGWEDNSVGDLFKGLGQDLELGIKTADEFLGRRVNDAARALVEPIRDDTIAGLAGFSARNGGDKVAQVMDPQNVNPTTGEVEVPEQELPAEAQASFNRLSNVQTGVRAGLLSDTYYRSQLDAVSKQLRRQFPGYEDAIDRSLENLTGSIPANRLLSDLQSQASAVMSSANSSDNKLKQNYFQAVKDGLVDSRLHPLSSLGGQQDLANLIAPRAMAKASLELNSAYMADTKSRNELDDRDTEKRARADASNITSAVFSDMYTPLGKRFQEINDHVGKLDMNQPWSKEDNATLTVQANQLEAGLRTKLNETFAARIDADGNSRASLLGPDKTKAIIDAQVERGMSFMDAIRDKKTGEITHNNALTKAWEAGLKGKYLQNEDIIAMKVVQEIGGPSAVEHLLGTPAGARAMGAFGTLAHNDAVLGIASGKYSSLNDAINQTFEPSLTPAQRKAVGDEMVGSFQGALAADDVGPQLKERIVKALYGPQNQGFITTNIPLFTKMGDPKTIDMIRKFSVETNKPELWNMTADWVIKSGTSLAMTQASTLQNAVVYNKYTTVTYNPKSHSLDLVKSPTGIDDPRLNGLQNMAVDAINKYMRDPAAKSAVDQMNSIIQGMTAAFVAENPKATEENINMYVHNMLKTAGVELNSAKQPDGVQTIFGAMFDAVNKSFPQGNIYGPEGLFRPDGQGGIQLTFTRNLEDQIVPRTTPGNELGIQGSNNGAIGSRTSPRQTYQVVPKGTFKEGTPTRAGMMRLGGPGEAADGVSPDGQGGGSGPPDLSHFGGSPSEVRQGVLQDLKEMTQLYSKTEDPEQRAEILKDITSLREQYRGIVSPQSFQPRGNPAPGVPTEAQSETGKSVVDAITGVPSLVDSVKEGDIPGAALAAATVIPFPAGKLGRVAKGIEDGIAGLNEAIRTGGGNPALVQIPYGMTRKAEEIFSHLVSKGMDEETAMARATKEQTGDVIGTSALDVARAQKIGQAELESKIHAQMEKFATEAATKERNLLEQANTVIEQMTPTEIGQRIDELRKGHKEGKELAVLLKARELSRENLRR